MKNAHTEFKNYFKVNLAGRFYDNSPFGNNAMAQVAVSQMLTFAFDTPMGILRHISNDSVLGEMGSGAVLRMFFDSIAETLRTGWVVIGVDGGLLDGGKRPLWSQYNQYAAVSASRLDLKVVNYICLEDYMVATIDGQTVQLQIKIENLESVFAELLDGKYHFFTGNPFEVKGFSLFVDFYSKVNSKELYSHHPQCVLETKEIPVENGFYDYGRYGYCDFHDIVFPHPNGTKLLVLKSTLDTLRPYMGKVIYVAHGSKPYLRGTLNGKGVGFRGSEAFVESEKWSLDDWAANL